MLVRQLLSDGQDTLDSEVMSIWRKNFVNQGFLHAVGCEWCGLKMSCNCWDGNHPDREGHILVLCPRCQVTNFLNLLFGAEDLRSVLISKIEQAASVAVGRTERVRPQLKIIRAGDQAGVTADSRTKS